jgi:hypothetical protein
MGSTLTGTRVRQSYTQLLHIDGGPESTEKRVLSGAGVATALSLGTGSATIGSVRLQGNVLSAVSGLLQLEGVQILGGSIEGISPLPVASGGTGAGTAAAARTNLGLGALATQDPAAVAITGGVIGGTFVGTFNSTVSLSQISNRQYGAFSALTTQAAVANSPAAVSFNDSAATNSGVNLSSATEIVASLTGLYDIRLRLALRNAAANDHDATVWLRVGGLDVPASAATVTVPKAGDGGAMLLSMSFMQSLQAGQVLSVIWATEHADLSLGYQAAQTVPFPAPAAPAATCIVNRIA